MLSLLSTLAARKRFPPQVADAAALARVDFSTPEQLSLSRLVPKPAIGGVELDWLRCTLPEI